MSNSNPISPSRLPLALARISLQGTWISTLSICWIAWAGISALEQTSSVPAAERPALEQADQRQSPTTGAPATVLTDVLPLPEMGPNAGSNWYVVPVD